MKKVLNITSVVLMLLVAMGLQAFAINNVDKTTEKARAVIEKAAPDDWESYAKAAKMCIRKNVNLKEAKDWLDTSIEINDSALGNEVAGDYFIINKLYKKAIDHYVKSMLKIKEANFYADTSDLQKKIEKAKAKV